MCTVLRSRVWWLLTTLAPTSFARESAVHETMGRDDPHEQRLYAAILHQPRPGPGFEKWWEYGTSITTPEELRALCDRRADQRPETAEPLMLLGLVEQRLGDPEAALRCFERATELHPGASLPLRLRAHVLADRGRYQDAAAALGEALELGVPGADRIDIERERGRLELNGGLRGQALDRWRRLAHEHGADAALVEDLAELLDEEGESQAALELHEALFGRPGLDAAIRFRAGSAAAQIERRLGREAAARERWARLLPLVDSQSWQGGRLRDCIERSFVQHGDHEGLARFWAARIAEAPDDVDARTTWALALLEAGRIDEAVTRLREVFEAAPERGDLAESTLRRFAKLGQAERALPLAHGFAARAPEDVPAALRHAALQVLAPGHPEENRALAAEILEGCAAENADDAERLHHLGQASARLNREPAGVLDDPRRQGLPPIRQVTGRPDSALLAAAERFLARALELDPDHDEVLVDLAALLHHRGRHQRAQETWRRYVAHPRDAPARFAALARVQQQLGLATQAALILEEALTLHPGHFELRRQRLELALGQGDRPSAREHGTRLFQTAVEDRELSRAMSLRLEAALLCDDVEAEHSKAVQRTDERGRARDWWWCGLLGAELGDEGAALAFQRAFELAEDRPMVGVAMAEQLEAVGDGDRARQAWVSLAERHPAEARGYQRREVELLLQMGEPRKAANLIDSLLAAAPRDLGLLTLQAEAFSRLGRHRLAISCLQEALAIASGDARLHAALAHQFQLNGDFREAFDEFWLAYEHGDAASDRESWLGEAVALARHLRSLPALADRLRVRMRGEDDPKVTGLHLVAVLRVDGRTDQADEALDGLHRRVPDDVEVLDAVAARREARLEFGDAARLLERRVALQFTTEACRHLATMLTSAGRREDARRRWTECLPDDQDAMEPLLRQLAEDRGLRHAVDAAIAGLEERPTDPMLCWRAAYGAWREGAPGLSVGTLAASLEDLGKDPGFERPPGDVADHEASKIDARETWIPAPFLTRTPGRLELAEHRRLTTEGLGVALAFSPFQRRGHYDLNEYPVPVFLGGRRSNGAACDWPEFPELEQTRVVLARCREFVRDEVPPAGIEPAIDATFLADFELRRVLALLAACLSELRDQGQDVGPTITAITDLFPDGSGARQELRLALRSFALEPSGAASDLCDERLEHFLLLDGLRGLCSRSSPQGADTRPRVRAAVASVIWLAEQEPDHRVHLVTTTACWLANLRLSDELAPLLRDVVDESWSTRELLHLAPWVAECSDAGLRSVYEQRLLARLDVEAPAGPLRLSATLSLLQHCRSGLETAAELLAAAAAEATVEDRAPESPSFEQGFLYVHRGDASYDLVDLRGGADPAVIDGRFHALASLLRDRARAAGSSDELEGKLRDALTGHELSEAARSALLSSFLTEAGEL